MPVGVILATYGEPPVNSFAQQWVYSYRILKGLTRKIARIPAPILPIIATARARGRVRLWHENGFLSPLEKLHRDTVHAVRDELARRGHSADTLVIPAYEFRRPNLTETLRQLDQAGCEKAIVVPMYIAEGDFTHGVTQFAIEDAAAALPNWRGRVKLASMTQSASGVAALGNALASWFFDALKARRVNELGKDWAVMLAAHGTVVNPPPGVDNGLAHFQDVLKHVEAAIAPRVGRVSVGWLNHTRGGEWTKPAVPDALAELRAQGYKNLVYFPWGFTTDNAETMLEGRVALREMAEPFGRVEYLECLNSYPPFIGVLTDVIEKAIGAPQPDPGPGSDKSSVAEHGLKAGRGAQTRIKA
jgi:ferrochelatase